MPRTNTRGVPLTEAEAQMLKTLALKQGEDAVAKFLDINPHTLLRAMSGMKLNRSTVNGIRARLKDL